MDQRKIDLRGNIINIAESIGKGFPVIFVHGNSLSSKVFLHQIESDLGNHYRFIAFDFPGHGESEKSGNPEKDYSIKGMINTLTGVVKALNLKEYIIVAHSLGGHVAIQSSPQLNGLKGLMLFGTPPIPIPPVFSEYFLPNPALNFLFKGALEKNEMDELTSAMIAEKGEARDFILSDIIKTDPPVRDNIGKSIMECDFGGDEIQILKQLQIPISVVHGLRDTIVNLDYIKKVSFKNLWENEIKIIPNAGHCPQLENAKEFNTLLGRFLDFVTKKP